MERSFEPHGVATTSRVRVYIACSFDGFIAGPGDDLSWLPGANGESIEPLIASDSEPGAVSFEEFLQDVGALLMGRRSYDVVTQMGGNWPYGDRTVLVATHRSLEPFVSTVRPAQGTIEQLVRQARELALERDVYLDGGNLIRQALDAGLVDEMIVTVVPVILGGGYPLFAGTTKRHHLEILSHQRFAGSMVQFRARPRRFSSAAPE